MAARSGWSADAELGARFLRPLSAKAKLELRATVSHSFADTDMPVSAQLAGQAGSFTVFGTPEKRDALNLAATLGGELARNASAFLQAAYQNRGSGQNSYGLSLWVKKTF